MSMYSLLIEPILTEKSNMLRTEPRGDCKIINVKPKKKNRRMSRRGYTRSYKKAIIVLDGKESIDIVK